MMMRVTNIELFHLMVISCTNLLQRVGWTNAAVSKMPTEMTVYSIKIRIFPDGEPIPNQKICWQQYFNMIALA